MAEEEKNVEEAAAPAESKPKSSWMGDTTLIIFFGVIFYAVVLWFSANIYLCLATFALTLFFGKVYYAVSGRYFHHQGLSREFNSRKQTTG